MHNLKNPSRALIKMVLLATFAVIGVFVGPSLVSQTSTAHATGEGVLKVQVKATGMLNDYAAALIATQSRDFGNCGGRFMGYAVIPVSTEGVTTCTGVDYYIQKVQNGSQGFYLTRSAGGSANFVYNWSVASNTSNGSAECYGYGCTLNYNSGTVVLNLEISPRPDLARFGYVVSVMPRLSTTSVTDSTVQLSWTPGLNTRTNESVVDYWIYKNDGDVSTGWAGIQQAPTATSYTVSGLKACTTYQFMLTMTEQGGRDFSNPQTVRTTGCATPSPTEDPISTDSTTALEGLSYDSSGYLQGSDYDLGSSSFDSSISVDSPDQSSIKRQLSMPQYFSAIGKKGMSAVSLNWGASTGSGKVHYVLERSKDGKQWELISDTLTWTSYNDYATQFSNLYYYRVTAVDEQNMASPSAIVSINTSKFEANVGKGRDLKLVSKDKSLQIYINHEALPGDANCSFADTSSMPLIGDKQHQIVGGPYKVICQQQDGSTVDSFKLPVSMRVVLPSEVIKKYKKVEVQAYSAKEGVWKPVASTQKQPGTIELDSDNMALVALAEPRGTPLWMTILIILFVGGSVSMATVLVARYGLRMLQRRRVQDVSDDFWHKTNGV